MPRVRRLLDATPALAAWIVMFSGGCGLVLPPEEHEVERDTEVDPTPSWVAPDVTQPEAPPPTRSSLPGDSLFVEGQVLDLQLTLTEADRLAIEERGNEELYVAAEGTIRGTGIGEVSLGQIGLRHKGAWSLHHCWDDNGGVRNYSGGCAKLSYKVKFNEFNDSGRLDGLKRLNLHASSSDATRLHELLAYDTFRAFGVDAPRTAVVRVTVNGQFEGLFIGVEAIDGRYTKAHYPDGGGDGNLYKEIWPTPSVRQSKLLTSLRTNTETPDVSAFLGFASAVGNASPSTFAADMERWVDLEHTLRYVAVDRALKNWDGIMAFYSPSSPHNFYWYHDVAGTGRFSLVPWDMDNTLWDFDPYMAPEQWVTAPPVPDWNRQPASCDERPVWQFDGGTTITPPRCDLFLDRLANTHWNRFAELGSELLDDVFGAPRMLARLQHFAALIEPVIEEDPFIDVDQWRYERGRLLQTLQQANDDLRAYVEGGLRIEAAVAPTGSLTLDVTSLNDFENANAADAGGVAEVGVTTQGDSLATISASWNFDNPVAGQSDLKFDFAFERRPGAWNEWANLIYMLPGEQTVDLTSKNRIVVTLVADRTRTLRIRIASPAYNDTFGGVSTEFGKNVTVTSTPTTFTLSLSDFAYADWGRASWTDGQGWTSSDAEAYALLLARFSGLIFAPSGTFDSEGELTAQTEAGYLQIDDISFQ